jgi:hypothetical protein
MQALEFIDEANLELPLAGYDGAAPFTIATFCKWP